MGIILINIPEFVGGKEEKEEEFCLRYLGFEHLFQKRRYFTVLET